jgi:hypothetical protein
MNRRASDFANSVRDWLAGWGPGVRSVTVQRCAAWTVIKIGVISDDVLRLLAAELGLDQARTEQRGRVWWRTMYSTAEGVVVIAAGPARELEDPERWTGERSEALPS